MEKTCKQCATNFAIAVEDSDFYDKVSPVYAGTKYLIPPPDYCPDCRSQRRLAWRNERVIYNRTCDLCKRQIVSVYPADATFPVYCNKCWWSDKWDPMSYGIKLNLDQPFLDQYKDLRAKVPQLAIQNDDGIGSENCEYCYDFSRGKNCYRVVGSWFIEESMYDIHCNQCKFIIDCYNVNIESELVYESTDSEKLYNCAFLENSENCSDCILGIDLKGCRDCIGCVNLRQKQFHIFNQPYTKEEYERKKAEMQLDSYTHLEHRKEEFAKWNLQFPRKCVNMKHCENCTGDNLAHCKNVYGYSVINGEGSKFIDRADGPKFSYDIVNSGDPQWCLDCVTPDKSYMTLFSVWCWMCKNTLYSDNCHSCEHVLGSISLKRKKYCILNKEYTPEEYERLAPLIIENLTRNGDWGGLFPIRLSPFGYNESAAHGYFPITESDARTNGWKWQPNLPYTTNKETLAPTAIPDRIGDTPATLPNEILACITCKKNYKIIAKELAFYQKMNLPIPRKCPDCRNAERVARRTAPHTYNRACAHCTAVIQTSYAPDRSETVYCEKCYLEAVY